MVTTTSLLIVGAIILVGTAIGLLLGYLDNGKKNPPTSPWGPFPQ